MSCQSLICRNRNNCARGSNDCRQRIGQIRKKRLIRGLGIVRRCGVLGAIEELTQRGQGWERPRNGPKDEQRIGPSPHAKIASCSPPASSEMRTVPPAASPLRLARVQRTLFDPICSPLIINRIIHRAANAATPWSRRN
jgi:hypothetical protein